MSTAADLWRDRAALARAYDHESGTGRLDRRELDYILMMYEEADRLWVYHVRQEGKKLPRYDEVDDVL